MSAKFRWAVTQHAAVGPCPKAYRGGASIWVTARDPKKALEGLWERLPIAFNAEKPADAEAKARAWMLDSLAKARANHLGGKGRRNEMGVADELFEAMGALSEAYVEATSIRDEDLATDQRGYALREMPEEEDDEEI